MRIAALAFGVVAGLVASLILALGGLDVGAAAGVPPDRQIQVTRFGLFVIANLGVFGAGLVLALPLGGAVLFVIGAIAWVVAALLLHHSTDLVVIVPPALLLVATILSVIAFLRRGRRLALPPLKLGRQRRAAEAEADAYDAPPSRAAAAALYAAGEVEPSAAEPSIGGLDERSSPPVDWTPGKRRPPPPRQKPMFRSPDEEIEESGLARVSRGISSILSFGLYGAIAVAALLVFWNVRSAETVGPAAAKLEPAAPSEVEQTATIAPVLQPSAAPAVAVPEPTSVPAPASSSAPAIPPELMAGVVVADDPAPEVSFEPPDNVLAAGGPQPDATVASVAGTEPPPDAAFDAPQAASADSSAAVMPFPMPLQLAAERAQPSSRPATRQVPATQLNTTGL